MDNAGFDPTYWAHWLLIGSFVGIAILGLYSSWQWNAKARSQRKKSKVARRLAIEVAETRRFPSNEARVGQFAEREPQRFADRQITQAHGAIEKAFASSHSARSQSK